MLLTANLPRRVPSVAAAWALRLAVFLPVLAALSILAHRGGTIETPAFLILMALCAVICLAALGLFMAGLRSLWVHGKRGGRKLSWALFLLLPFLAFFGWVATNWIVRPMVSQVSTNLVDPPLFAAEIGGGAISASALVAAQLVDGYPALTGVRFKAPLDVTVDLSDRIAAEIGWQRQRGRGRVGADDAVFAEYVYKTPVLSLPLDIVVRAADEGETSFVDVRARMRFLPHDLGLGARVAGRFQAELDYAMIGVAEP